MGRKRLTRAAVAVGVGAFWLLLWQAASVLTARGLLLMLVPTPLEVARTLATLAGQASFWRAVAHSLRRVATGFAAGAGLGVALAVLAARFGWLRRLLAPPLHIIRAAPVASFIILALVWIRTDTLPAFIALLMVLPLLWDAVLAGLAAADGQLLELALAYRLSRWRRWRHIRLPALLPHLAAASANAVGFAWKSAVAAEILCRPADSLGRLLQEAKSVLEIPAVFAYTAVMILLSAGLQRLLRLLVRRAEGGVRHGG